MFEKISNIFSKNKNKRFYNSNIATFNWFSFLMIGKQKINIYSIFARLFVSLSICLVQNFVNAECEEIEMQGSRNYARKFFFNSANEMIRPSRPNILDNYTPVAPPDQEEVVMAIQR